MLSFCLILALVLYFAQIATVWIIFLFKCDDIILFETKLYFLYWHIPFIPVMKPLYSLLISSWKRLK
jgi:hypothetical protein